MKNKVSIEDLAAKIKSREYLKIGKKTTLCLLTLDNGFEIVGTSSAVDTENYGEEIGKPIAYKRAVDKLWMLEGYNLQESNYQRLLKN